ncbi:MAG: lipopolysaccharide core heptose(I) kinase RfaP [Arsenophonus sp.]|nr:MAG: lipopolysaccharide core heptose(I) kinase RfaP [Arsenophonus sp.]
MFDIQEPFKSLWKDKDPFKEIETLNGKIIRQLEKRKTSYFIYKKEKYFIKIHYGISIKEIIKNLFFLRLPVFGAKREWKIVQYLTNSRIDTMDVRVFAEQKNNILQRKSFIITRALSSTISLDNFCKNWKNISPNFQIKKILISTLAQIINKMHKSGVNHRDCYICHFLLHIPIHNSKKIKISVIDLHRAQLRKIVPKGWKNKDLIGLYYSSLNIGLTKRDIFRFLKVYFNNNLRNIFNNEKKMILNAAIKAKKIQNRTIKHKL